VGYAVSGLGPVTDGEFDMRLLNRVGVAIMLVAFVLTNAASAGKGKKKKERKRHLR